MSRKNAGLLTGLLLCVAVAGGIYFFTRKVSPPVDKPADKVAEKPRAVFTFEMNVDGPGMSTEEVDHAVAVPLVEAVRRVKGVGPVHSIAEAGRVRLVVPVTDGDEFAVRQDVLEGVARFAPMLPAGVHAPVLVTGPEERLPDNWFTLESDTHSLIELGAIAEQLVARPLTLIPGVARVEIEGVGKPIPTIRLDPDRLRAFALDVADVHSALAGEPQAKQPDDVRKLGETVVAKKGDTTILLRDVADVQSGAADSGVVIRNGRRVVAVAVYLHSTADRADVDKRLRQLADERQKLLPEGIAVSRVWEPNKPDAHDLMLELRLPDGASIEQTDETVRRLERDLADAFAKDARVELAVIDKRDPQVGRIFVSLTGDAREAVRRIRNIGQRLPGALLRVADLESQSPPRAAVFPLRFAVLGDAIAVESFLGELAKDPTIFDVFGESGRRSPNMQLRVDRTKAAELGVSMADVTRTLETAISGTPIANGRYLVKLGADARISPEALRNLWLKGKDGRIVRLGEVATFEMNLAVSRIDRLDGKPCTVVTAGLEPGMTPASAIKAIETLAEKQGLTVRNLP